MIVRYGGPATLISGDTQVRLNHVTLGVDQRDSDYYFSALPSAPSLRAWRGYARLPGMVLGLLDILGSEAKIRLPDGREATVLTTGTSEDSAWIVELTGVGPPPWWEKQ
jgi:hypothetical protein